MTLRKKIEKKENIYLKHMLIDLRKTSNANKVKIWKRIADDLSGPTRKIRVVNVSKLNTLYKEKEIIIVPGKVLGFGKVDKTIKVAAFSFSQSAKEKILASNGSCLKISELIRKNPKGNNVRIIG